MKEAEMSDMRNTKEVQKRFSNYKRTLWIGIIDISRWPTVDKDKVLPKEFEVINSKEF